MARPGIVPGSDDPNDLSKFAAPVDEGGTKQSMWVFATYPGATPKYALNVGQRDAEYRETMARLFVQVSEEEREKFVSSCPPETRPLAEVLCGAGASAAGGTGFVDFLLTSVNEQFQEKVQVVESLSDNLIIYTFGQRAPTFSYAGVLLNTYQDDQRVWMLRLYQDVLRGTQLARRRKLARLRYDSVIVSGIFTMHSQTLTADLQTKADFQFSFIPTQYVIFTEALAHPTQLRTAFTDGGQYNLSDAKAANMGQLQVAAPKEVIEAPQPAAVTEAAVKAEEAGGPVKAATTPTPPTPPPNAPTGVLEQQGAFTPAGVLTLPILATTSAINAVRGR